MSAYPPPISGLRPETAYSQVPQVPQVPGTTQVYVAPGSVKETVVTRDSWVTYIIVFIVIAIIAYLILWALRPQWLRREDGSIDVGKTLGASLVIAFILVLIWWAIRSCSRPY